MSDNFTTEFFAWIDSSELAVRDVALSLNKEDQTVFNWRSKGVPKAQLFACQSLMEAAQRKKLEELRHTMLMKPTHKQHKRWNLAALDAGMTIEDWAFEGLEDMAREYFLCKKITQMPKKKAHLQAAAGSPIDADVIDWRGDNNTVRIQINGLSMSPKFEDREIVEMRHKRASHNPYMNKGMIYLVEYDGGYTVKHYNTRPAKEDEKGEEWVERGRVKVLESINPDYAEIIIKQPLEWFAWYDGK